MYRGDNGGMSALVPLIETSRGGAPECLHFGAVAVVDSEGTVVASAGERPAAA